MYIKEKQKATKKSLSFKQRLPSKSKFGHTNFAGLLICNKWLNKVYIYTYISLVYIYRERETERVYINYIYKFYILYYIYIYYIN